MQVGLACTATGRPMAAKTPRKSPTLNGPSGAGSEDKPKAIADGRLAGPRTRYGAQADKEGFPPDRPPAAVLRPP